MKSADLSFDNKLSDISHNALTVEVSLLIPDNLDKNLLTLPSSIERLS